MATHRIIFGDSRQMLELEPESVHLVVTSPPYWCIKDYAHPGQIGYDQDYDEYLSDLRQALDGCHTALHRGCRAAVNIGDQYLRAAEHGRYRVQPIPADIIRIGRDVGFDFMGNIIWEKVSTTNTTGGGTWMGSVYHPKDGHITYEHEYIILFRKKGTWPRPTPEQKRRSRLTKEQRSEWFRGVWRIQPERQEGHVAMFPVEVPLRLIRMYSFHGETVLDPFLGSGTTALAAEQAGRNSVGYEINPDFEELIRGKFGLDGLFSSHDGITFERRKESGAISKHNGEGPRELLS
jgi:site-specific DNA-methyltransferase (adenine-specific)